MTYYRKEFYTKNLEIQKYIDSLIKNRVVELPPKVAQDIGRNKTIRDIREMDRKNPYLLIGADQKYHISIIRVREPVRIVRVGNKYVFSF